MAQNLGNREYHDMIMAYGLAQGNAREAARIYADTYPARHHPVPRSFTALSQRLLDTGRLMPDYQGKGRERIAVEVQERILDIVQDDPTTSVRRIGLQVGSSPSAVHRVLREEGLHPYHIQTVQSLLEEDLPRRVRFCTWFIDKCERDLDFIRNICCADESTFTRDGIVNFHNYHQWQHVNPHAIRQGHFQHRFSINVWMGVMGDQLLGPYILPRNLNGELYLEFLQTRLEDILDGLPLNILRRMWFLHDGCPAHTTIIVRDHLNNVFGDRWIGNNGPTRWPPRSPDLNPVDFCVWGFMKNKVYSSAVNTEEELEQRIYNAANELRNKPGIFENIRTNWLRRMRLCAENNGRHFEMFL